MRRWFLSYHSPDEKLAEGLKAAIERKDSEARVFFAPAQLRAGGFWSRALADEIAQADAFILLMGESGIGNWQELEYYAALDRRAMSQFPLVLVLLQGQTAPGLPFLRQLHWIVTPDPTSEKDVARLIDALETGESATPGELWRFTSPYRGLAAMEEKDSDYFFGRDRETGEVLDALAATPNRLALIIGNSGVGKSSLAQAGVLAALKRQARPQGTENSWAFQDSRQWCFLTLNPGSEPLKALVRAFLDTWQFDATDPDRVKRQNDWIELLLADEKVGLADLLDATERRYAERDLAKPPAFFLYVDQGEELYVRGEKRQSRRFSEILMQALSDPRFRAMMSLRSDFFGELQKDGPLFNARRQIDVLPLGTAQLHDVVNRPAEELSARFENPALVDIITRRTHEDSAKDVGALPLLSYTLDDMWTEMVKRGDGVLRLPAQSFELGGVLVDRANSFLNAHPGAEDCLRRIFTLKLATVREGEEPTRRRALRSEFSDEEWRLISELADHPYRLLVAARPESGEIYAEVAHEALFRRWTKLNEWIAAEREFLAWKTGLEAARLAWKDEGFKSDALLMGAALTKAEAWLAKRPEDLPEFDRKFIDGSAAQEKTAQARVRRVQTLAFAALVIIIFGLLGVINQAALVAQWHWWGTERPYAASQVWPHVLTADAERALKPGQSFRECARDCPEMIVVPAGRFMMGSPPNEPGHSTKEGPQPHPVVIANVFAVGAFAVTFDDWDACVRLGDCPDVSDSDWGRGRQPVINVSWDEAQQYVAWFSKMTGKTYRLLSEAEWEYAARAGTTTAYYWGEAIGRNNADCQGCGSQWDDRQPAPVDSFKPNAFGLYMAGNVWQWVEDCLHPDYAGAPNDGSAWTTGQCRARVFRGGSWTDDPPKLRSASRYGLPAVDRYVNLGFRVARTLGH